ncbi:hypothetical protein GCM10023083_60950 [Streptomyces phyllanthi]
MSVSSPTATSAGIWSTVRADAIGAATVGWGREPGEGARGGLRPARAGGLVQGRQDTYALLLLLQRLWRAYGFRTPAKGS